MGKELKVGQLAPGFTLPRDGGGDVSLEDFKSRKLVLYFYPRADTPGCTREAIDFSKLRREFDKAEQMLRQVLEKDDRLADVHDMLGVICHSRGNFGEA